MAAAVLALAVVAGGLLVRHAPGVHDIRSARDPRPSASPSGSPPPPVLVAGDAGAPAPATGAVAAALRGPLSDSHLGHHVAVRVLDATTGAQLFAQHATDPTTPASTMKLATTTALLALRGPGYQLQTRVVAGTKPGEVVLIGGGDPTLAATNTPTYPGAPRLSDLAAQVRKALGGTKPTKVIYDSSLFTGSDVGPGWDAGDVDTGGESSRITALMTDGGRTNPANTGLSPRARQPDLAAAQAFARLLGLPTSAVAAGRAPGSPSGAPTSPAAGSPPGTQLGVVRSQPLVALLEQMLATSDNTIAEMMARQVALAMHQPASFGGGATAVTQELTKLGLPMGGVHIVDGSGLSHQNRLTANLLTSILALATRVDQPSLHSLFTGLPVAGYSGTLQKRFASPAGNPAEGDLRAKTGTLVGVSTLAGYVVDAKGRLLAFAAMSDQVTTGTWAAEQALDQIGIALARVS